MLRQVLGLMETVLGKEHPSTLGSRINMAEVLRRQGKDEQAEEMLRQVLGRMETVLGKEHPSTLGSMIQPGKCTEEAGQVRAGTPAEGDGAGRRAFSHGGEHEQPGAV